MTTQHWAVCQVFSKRAPRILSEAGEKECVYVRQMESNQPKGFRMDAIVEKLAESGRLKEKHVYLAASPTQEDRGELIGRLPQEISVADLQALGGPQSPIKAIRAKCIDCSGGNAAEARKCVAFGCALWPFRMGRNPFWGKGDEDDHKLEAAE